MKRTAKSAIDSVKAALVKTQRDELIHTSDDELRQSQLSFFDLAPWDDDMRAMPNDYARSALFTVRNKKKKREACDNKAIFHVNKDVTITYTGIELRAEDDELVWQQILEYAKNYPLGQKIHFSIYQLCKDLGWAVNGRYYKKAEECLTRLQATSMAVASERLGRLKSLSLIKEFEIVERGTKKAICEVELSPQMIYLFAGDHYTKFTWIKYRKLSPITRRLFDYMASHKEPFPLKLETFKMMCGSDTEQGWKWKQQAKDACAELAESGLVGSSWVQGDAIYCVRATDKKSASVPDESKG